MEDAPAASIADQQVALDFVNAITQLVRADAAVLNFPPPEDEVGPVLSTIRVMVERAGFATEQTTASPGAQTVRYRVGDVQLAGANARRHDIAIGRVELQRSYRSTGTGMVLPVSALYIRGADASAVRMMDEELFGAGNSGNERGRPSTLPDVLLTNYRYLLSDTPVIDSDPVVDRDGQPPTEAAVGE